MAVSLHQLAAKQQGSLLHSALQVDSKVSLQWLLKMQWRQCVSTAMIKEMTGTLTRLCMGVKEAGKAKCPAKITKRSLESTARPGVTVAATTSTISMTRRTAAHPAAAAIVTVT
jgi:hypothetical protein